MNWPQTKEATREPSTKMEAGHGMGHQSQGRWSRPKNRRDMEHQTLGSADIFEPDRLEISSLNNANGARI